MTQKNDGGMAPKAAAMARCPQCRAPLQHVKRDGIVTLRCPNCDTGRGTRQAAAHKTEPTPALVGAG